MDRFRFELQKPLDFIPKNPGSTCPGLWDKRRQKKEGCGLLRYSRSSRSICPVSYLTALKRVGLDMLELLSSGLSGGPGMSDMRDGGL